MSFRCLSPLNTDTLFESEHLAKDLGKKSVHGGVFTMMAQCGSFVLQMLRIIVLARLLSPEDFGLIGMVMVLTGFLSIFKDAGLSMATVQREDINHEQISSLFWINVAISCILALVMAASSPLVAWFYKQPELLTITLALSLTFPITGLFIQHQALLRRHMRFGTLTFIQLSTTAFALAVAIIGALIGWRYWALVASMMAGPIFNLLLIFWLVPWKPGKFRRGTGALPMLKFGGHLTIISFLEQIQLQYPIILAGRFFGPEILAFIQRARQLFDQPIKQTKQPVMAVTIPALSRLQNEPEAYRKFFKYQWILMRLAMVPISCCAIVMYDWIVKILLGPQWYASIPFYFISVVGTVFVCGSWSTECLFTTQGRTKDMLKFVALRVFTRILVVSVAIFWGPIVMLIATVAHANIMLIPTIYLAGKSGPVGRWMIGKLCINNGLLLFVCAGLGWAIRGLVTQAQFPMIANFVIVGILCFLISSAFLMAFPEHRNVFKTLIRHIRSREVNKDTEILPEQIRPENWKFFYMQNFSSVSSKIF